MSKSVLFLLALATLSSACGASNGGAHAGFYGSIDAREVRRYERIINAGLDAYEQELREAGEREYPSRLAALEAARSLGSEARMIHHIRRSLASEGLSVEHLCQFSADHPGYPDSQRRVYRARMERWNELVDHIATAPVSSDVESGEALASGPATDSRNDG